MLPGSFADLLSRNSWSFCFTSVLATAPVRPKDGSKGIGVTLGLQLRMHGYRGNIQNQTSHYFKTYIYIYWAVLIHHKLFWVSRFSLHSLRGAATTCVGRSPPSGVRAVYWSRAAEVILQRDVLSPSEGYSCRVQFQITRPDKVINPLYY